jgi:two-component sensor histidine kinase
MQHISRLLKSFCFSFLFLAGIFLYGQTAPIAKFSFNNGRDYDEVSGKKAKLKNVLYCKDRFGNDNYAVFVSGSDFSYINLGTYKALKPQVGSISLWVNLEGAIYSGRGYPVNPILLTKQTKLDDFYEAYSIYYKYESKKFSFVQSLDSLTEINTITREGNYLNKWHHIVITYNNHDVALYLDGRMESSVSKNFKTVFLNEDSVMVGHTGNKKNHRFMCGSVDDIEFYDHVLTDAQVIDLYNAPNPNRNFIILRWILIICGIIILGIAIYFYTRYRVRVAVGIEKQRLDQVNTALENELRVHRALMNPHFIFNTLNGLHDLILKKEYDDASDYLIKLSQLLRKILESNMSDVISLELEAELLQRYIEIENLRFEEHITYSIVIDPSINPSTTIIPIMMVQPFVENAIWHGLLSKEGEKAISILFERYEQKYIKCVIEDNGSGLRPMENKKDKKSLATLFIKQRLALLNKIHHLTCSVVIEDREGGGGTRVTIILPILNG